jgi:hypothetical protein
MTEPQPAPARFDSNDSLFYVGLLMLGIGLAVSVSWETALIVVGSVLASVGVVNSFVVMWFDWLSNKKC